MPLDLSAGRVARRWLLPGALFLSELAALSLAFDLPTAGPALRLGRGISLLIPVVFGAAAGAWLLQRPALEVALSGTSQPPSWRPWPALALQLGAFTLAAALGWHLLREGAPPPDTFEVGAWLASIVIAGLLAIRIAAPLGWTLRVVFDRWRLPILAFALGLLFWRSAAAAEGLWEVLSSATLHAVAAVVQTVARGPVTVDPGQQLIGLSGFNVLIAPMCSGVDGLGMVLMFQVTWLSVARTRLRFPRALLLLPLGVVAALAANVLRISVLVLLGASGHQALALGGFHSKLGWILFVAIALGSVALAERTRWLRAADGAAGRDDGRIPDSAAACVAPLVAALGAAVLTGLFTDPPLDRWYVVRVAAALVVLAAVRRALPAPALSPSWTPVLLGLGVGILWIVPSVADGAPLRAALAGLSPAAWLGWIAVRAAGACLVIPVVEELAFRGFLLPWLSSGKAGGEPRGGDARTWTWSAVVVSSLAFGAVHDRWLLGTLAGLAFAAARLYRGRLGDAVLAHAVANAVVTVAVLWFGRWELWS